MFILEVEQFIILIRILSPSQNISSYLGQNNSFCHNGDSSIDSHFSSHLKTRNIPDSPQLNTAAKDSSKNARKKSIYCYYLTEKA